MTKLRTELVLENGEFFDGFDRKINDRTGNIFTVVVRAFDSEVVVARTLTSNSWSKTHPDAT